MPEFITSGDWRQCAPDGGVIVPVPLPTPQQPDAMRWPAAANVAFGIPEGFFIAPYGRERPLLDRDLPAADLAAAGRGGQDRRRSRRSRRRPGPRPAPTCAYWKANCVALAHGPNETALRTTLEQLLGPGTAIKDTWTWKVS